MVDQKRDREYTGKELLELIAEIKRQFQALGVKTGDVILIALENDAIFPLLEQALWELHVIVHPIAPSISSSEILTEIKDYRYQALIVDNNHVNFFDKVIDFLPRKITFSDWNLNFYKPIQRSKTTGEYLDSDLALILNTSGSTGKPKRVGLTYTQLESSVAGIVKSQKLSAIDSCMVVMPMFHVNAQVISLLATRVSGGKLVVVERFSASNFWDLLADFQVTWVSIVPTIVQILLINDYSKARFELRKRELVVNYFRSASFSLPQERLLAFEKLFNISIQEGYGMTEAASLIALNPLLHAKIGTVGIPVATEIALLIDGKLSKACQQAGEILLRGDHVIKAYLDENPASFFNGWLKTGDLGEFDEEGYLKIVGRKKEIINHGGEKVAPRVVENCLRELDFIKEVVVIGLPDSIYGEKVAAIIIPNLKDKLSENDERKFIEQLASEQLAKYERPTEVYFVDHYPINTMGKILRKKLIEEIVEKNKK